MIAETITLVIHLTRFNALGKNDFNTVSIPL